MVGCKQDDEELEMLLCEIPRATSAPPNGQRVGSPKGAEGDSTLSGNDMFVISSSPLSSYYGGSGPSSSESRNSPQSPLDQSSQLKGTAEQEQESSGTTMLNEHIFVDLSGVNRSFLADQALSNAFANLNFKENGHVDDNGKQTKMELLENGDTGVLYNKLDQSSSMGEYSSFNVIGTALPTQMNVENAPLSSSRTKSYGIDGSFQLSHSTGDFQSVPNRMSYLREVQTMKDILTQNGHGQDIYMNGLGLPLKTNSPAETPDFQQSIPIYSASTLPVPRIHNYQPFPSSFASEAENVASVSSLQQQSYLDPAFGSFVQPQSCRPPVSDLHQQMNRMNLPWYQLGEERRLRMQQELMLLQQANARLPAGLPYQVGNTFTGDACNRAIRQHGMFSPISNVQLESHLRSPHLQGAPFIERDWPTNIVPNIVGRNNFSNCQAQNGGDVCRYYAQGFCGRGEGCPFFHGQVHGAMGSRTCLPVSIPFKNAQTGGNLGREDKPIFPEKILTRGGSQGINSVTVINPVPVGGRKETPSNGHSNGRALLSDYSLPGSFLLDVSNHSRGISPEITEPEIRLRSLVTSQQQQPKYTSLDEIEGQIYFIAKDQHGCRFLQKKFDEGSSEDVQKIFVEIIDHIVELMTDPFGNYLVQKLLEVCNEDQKLQILDAVTRKAGELVGISLNMHGTRAVQKLIEILKTPQHVSMVISSLKPGVVTLIKDLNGNHVVQRCLQRLCSEDNQFLFDAAAAHCVEIATHRHGCCVLQRCVDHSVGAQKERLVAEIAANALVLSQDQFGNYVVQYVLELGMSWVTADVMSQLNGNYAYLSMQKFSSNVVEKCLKVSGEDGRACIVQELVNNSQFGQLLQDPFANYVVQCALTVCKGCLHSTLVDTIRPHIPALRSSPYGKRILSRTNLRK